MAFINGHNRRRTPHDYVEDLETGCWVWQRSLDGHGYGAMWDEGRVTKAHRVYYEWYLGPIPEGFDIDHLCRNRACVNPDHLDAVTKAENAWRSYFGRDGATGQFLAEVA